jgi:hypothetical protein
VPILLFLIFVVVVVLVIIGLSYGLSSVEEEQSISRRCQMPHEMHRRRNLRRRNVRCRFGG